MPAVSRCQRDKNPGKLRGSGYGVASGTVATRVKGVPEIHTS